VELIDLQSESLLNEKLKSLKLNDFYASLNKAPINVRLLPNIRILIITFFVCLFHLILLLNILSDLTVQSTRSGTA